MTVYKQEKAVGLVGKNSRERLEAAGTIVVADTGDLKEIVRYRPRDATTNPSLLEKASNNPEYSPLFEDAVAYGKSIGRTEAEQVQYAMDRLAVNAGIAILNVIKGRVSTEADAKHAYDKEKTVAQAHRIIDLYELQGVPRERVLIKVAATWEGVQAVRELEKAGIYTNSTLIFNCIQALAIAQVDGTLVSPFAGRKSAKHGKVGVDFTMERDPGALLVVDSYNYLKRFGHGTEIMGASIRTPELAIALAGCDLLTIPPEVIGKLESMDADVPRLLSPERAYIADVKKIEVDAALFRRVFEENRLDRELLEDGLKKFNEDARKLEERIREMIRAA